MKSAVIAPMTSTNDSAVSRQLEQRRHARHHEDAGGHHRRGVDQRRDRRRAFHRIRQPDVQRHLRRLAHRADEQADADHASISRPRRAAAGSRSSAPAIAGALREHRPRSRAMPKSGTRSPAMPRRKPKSPTRLTRNAFRLAKIAVGRVYQKPISRYDTRPTASQPKNSCRKLFAHHQHQHREGEQRDVAEEALVARVVVPCSRWCRCAPSATRR